MLNSIKIAIYWNGTLFTLIAMWCPTPCAIVNKLLLMLQLVKIEVSHLDEGVRHYLTQAHTDDISYGWLHRHLLLMKLLLEHSAVCLDKHLNMDFNTPKQHSIPLRADACLLLNLSWTVPASGSGNGVRSHGSRG